LAVWSIVDFSKIPFDWRLDAEYFQPRYLYLDNLLSDSDIELWGNLKGDFITGPFGSAFTVDNYVENSLYRYIRGKDVKPFFVLGNDNAYMPEKEFKNLEKHSLRIDDLLISVVGTLGNVAIVDEDVGQAIFSCKSTVFRSKSINPYYLCAYLNSSIGQAYFQRKPRGAIQLGLNLDDLHTIPIYIPSPEKQIEIGKLVKDSRESLKKSESLYAEAEALLLRELGLDTLDLSTQKTYVANFSETVEGDRFDAEYFHPKYYQLLELLNSAERKKGWIVKNLGHLSTKLKYGTSANLDYLNKGIPFLRITDLDQFRFDKDNLKYISAAAAKSEVHSSVKMDDVLVSRSGTLGLSIVIPKDLDGAIFGSYFIRTRPNKNVLNPVYLSLYLNSLIGKMQFERSSTGAIQTNLTIPVIESTLIVAPSLDVQNVIAQEVLRSIQAEDESKALLEQAKQNIEQMILG
jgi:restriction endonuclease S subunit